MGQRGVSRRRLWMGLAGLAVVVSALAVVVSVYRGRALEASTPVAQETENAGGSSSSAAAASVTLTEEAIQAAGLEIEPARMDELPVEIVVAGRIEPDVDRRMDIRTRTPGVIRSVAVVQGQKVKEGDLLATLDSAEVATARLNLRSSQRELAVARTEAEWRSEVESNVKDLVAALRERVPAATLEERFASRPLGNDRALLLATYADWEMARHEEEKQTELYSQRIVGENAATVAAHAREGAQARFEAAMEQVRYDAQRQKRLADQQVRLAESAVIDAAEHIRVLGVPVNMEEVLTRSTMVVEPSVEEPLTTYPIVAPFDGTILTRTVVASQQAVPTDVLMTLADLSTVWVMANISESDFGALPALRNATVRVTAAAYPGQTFEAKVLSVGAQVDPTTRTVPMVAAAMNPDESLKLGMFVRIVMDSAAAERAITVPSSAVTELEEKPVVFVPEEDGRTFTVRPVELGRETEGRQAIVSGLSEGEQVVTSGTFALKSELILQNEPEED